MTRLSLALPSKGRLKEQCEDYLAQSGIKLKQIGGSRGYAAELRGIEGIDVRLMSASEIARAVINGEVHLGVTGEDLLRESVSDLDDQVHILKPLGFGFARLIVAAPQSWIDVETMADLDAVGAIHQSTTGRRMRVATKYMRLAREFFAGKGVGHYRIVESAGATEGAPAAGTAELIVDITTTGSTLAANGLKIISDGEILASQAVLGASLKADWSADVRETLRTLMDYIEARQRAKRLKSLRYETEVSADVIERLTEEFGFIRAGDRDILCPEGKAIMAARSLTFANAGRVTIVDPEFVFEASNPVFESFANRLGDSDA